MDFFKQSTEYSCGPSAVHYLLHHHGYDYTLQDLEDALGPTPEFGTFPEIIEDMFSLRGINYKVRTWPYSVPMNPIKFPFLVNVNYEHDGDHYMVVTELDEDDNVTAWDPYTAELKYYPRDYFRMIHYSPLKKLKGWTLYLL